MPPELRNGPYSRPYPALRASHKKLGTPSGVLCGLTISQRSQTAEINALAAPTNPATATALANSMQQTSNTLSFILTPIKMVFSA